MHGNIEKETENTIYYYFRRFRDSSYTEPKVNILLGKKGFQPIVIYQREKTLHCSQLLHKYVHVANSTKLAVSTKENGHFSHRKRP